MYKLIKKNEQIIGAYKEENGCRISFNFNLSNTDYQAYLKWLEDPNNKPLPADE